MGVGIAVAHIVGSAVVSTALVLGVLFLEQWLTERRARRTLEEMSVTLGVPVEDFDKEEMAPKLLKLLAERFSSELLRNRISDFCGVMLTVWNWLGFVVQLVAMVGILWATIFNNLEAAVMAWAVIGIWLFFYIPAVIVSYTCLLLTGRMPGQAKVGRKSAAEAIKERAATAERQVAMGGMNEKYA